MREMQAQIAGVLGVHPNDSTVSLDSITSFAGSINTREGYKEFCKGLYQIGITPEMMNQRKAEILNIFNSENTGHTDDSTIEDQSQFPAVSG